MSNIDKQALADDESVKTYYIHPAAFGCTKNPGYRHVPVVHADDFEKQRAKLEAAEKRIAELEERTLTQSATDVLAERRRQITAEGWTPEHDDQYEDGELIDAAMCYAQDSSLWDCVGEPPSDWPWADEWWKPSKNMRRNLVKAGALILAEIERRDRAAGIGKEA